MVVNKVGQPTGAQAQFSGPIANRCRIAVCRLTPSLSRSFSFPTTMPPAPPHRPLFALFILGTPIPAHEDEGHGAPTRETRSWAHFIFLGTVCRVGGAVVCHDGSTVFCRVRAVPGLAGDFRQV
jgi:hypothetical protein